MASLSRRALPAWAFLVCMGVAMPARAQLRNRGVLDDTLEHFARTAQQWTDVAQQAASQLFWSLAVISLLWTSIQLLLSRAELGDIVRELCQFMMFTGFWAWMMRNGPRHAAVIIESLVALGGEMSGTRVRSPSGIFDLGFVLLDKMNEAANLLGWKEAVLLQLCGLIMVVLLAYIAALVLQVLVAGWLVGYGGVFVLGFGGAKWTHDMALNYYRTCLGIGLQAMATVLLVGAGQSILQEFAAQASAGMTFHEAVVLLTVTITLTVLVGKVPPQVGSLATGGGLQGLSGFDVPGSRHTMWLVSRLVLDMLSRGRSRRGESGAGGAGGSSPEGPSNTPGGTTGGRPGTWARLGIAAGMSQAVAREVIASAFKREPGMETPRTGVESPAREGAANKVFARSTARIAADGHPAQGRAAAPSASGRRGQAQAQARAGGRGPAAAPVGRDGQPTMPAGHPAAQVDGTRGNAENRAAQSAPREAQIVSEEAAAHAGGSWAEVRPADLQELDSGASGQSTRHRETGKGDGFTDLATTRDVVPHGPSAPGLATTASHGWPGPTAAQAGSVQPQRGPSEFAVSPAPSQGTPVGQPATLPSPTAASQEPKPVDLARPVPREVAEQREPDAKRNAGASSSKRVVPHRVPHANDLAAEIAAFERRCDGPAEES